MALPSSRILAGLAALLAFAGQVPGLARAWIWDDELLLRGTDLYTSPARWVESLAQPIGAETFYWRPLATSSFLVESLVHGGDALGFRVTAAALHAVLAAILYLLCARLVGSRGIAFGAAALWALHPAHMETVTWISGRFDLLAGLCAGLALLAVPPGGAASRVRTVLVGAASCAAVLAKENGVVLPVLVALWAATCDTEARPGWRELRRRVVPPAAAAAAGVAVALFARFESTGVLFGLRGAGLAEGLTERAGVVGSAVTEYLAILGAPWTNVGPAHHAVPPYSGAAASAGLLVLAAAVAAIAVAARRRSPRAFLGAALVVAFLPVLQIIPIDLAGPLLVADRYVYLPSLFAALLCAHMFAGVAAVSPRVVRPTAAVAVIVTVAVLLAASFVATRVVLLPRWNDPQRFWAWAAEMAPGSPFVHVSYGDALRRAGDLEAAEREARAAQGAHPRLLAEVLIDRGRLDEAIRVLDAAVSSGRADLDARLFRAECRTQAGDPIRAGEDADAVLKVLGDESRAYRPLRPTALAVAAGALAAAGDRPGASRALAEAERIAGADDARAWTSIAASAALLGEPDRVIAAAERGRAAGAPEITMRSRVADALADAGRHVEAAEELRRILALNPPVPAVFHDRLGYELFDAGDAAGAEAALRDAIAAAPEFARAHYHLAFLLAKTGRTEEAREAASRLGAILATRPDPALAPGLAALRAGLAERGEPGDERR